MARLGSALSLVLLTIVFRSIWVPIKAAVGFLLSVAAAFGIVAIVRDPNGEATDLSKWAGQKVELSLSYVGQPAASDEDATQRLGVFVDEVAHGGYVGLFVFGLIELGFSFSKMITGLGQLGERAIDRG